MERGVCGVWVCVQCGCVYSVGVYTVFACVNVVWVCVQCECVYSVGVRKVWACTV